jgi:tRNA-splicing ligase RtcB (3'-phosphate/5'-hydroxy nucleic acid ligase)
MSELKKIGPATYELPREGGMRVPGLVIATEELLAACDMEQPLTQVRNVAHLPGIVGHSIAMPDIHWGYGFPIGGVAAMDPTDGVISPGGVGYDINCGVRIAVLPLRFDELSDKARHNLVKRVFNIVPSGVGRGHKQSRGLTERDYRELLVEGAAWSVRHGFGFEGDLDHTESRGCIEGADPSIITQRARERGSKQLGSIGSGNHFVEIGAVGQRFDPKIASSWGIEEGQLYILIHSGSRGFGHQVCTDFLAEFVRQGYAENLPDRQLVAAPISSDAGKRYFGGMAAAANFAFNNRQQILHEVRKAVDLELGIPHEQVRLIYDVAHNIAKFEEHEGRRLCVHRKGATRAHEGQPVLVPGDMGRASHLLVGCANPLTFRSCCHGAGRARSRHKSLAAWKGRDPVAHMRHQDVEVMATSHRTIAEEMPDAYKDVDLVVDAVVEARLADRVVRLLPKLVIKG